MKSIPVAAIGLVALLTASLLIGADALDQKTIAGQESSGGTAEVEASIRGVVDAVDVERMSKHLFYLAKDPLPYRKLNFTLPGHEKNTLYEADDYLAGRLELWGYRG